METFRRSQAEAWILELMENVGCAPVFLRCVSEQLFSQTKSALVHHRNMVLAERCALLSAEILKSQGKYSDTATLLIKMTSEVRNLSFCLPLGLCVLQLPRIAAVGWEPC